MELIRELDREREETLTAAPDEPASRKVVALRSIRGIGKHNRVAAVGSPIAVEPEADKATRAYTQAAAVEGGRVVVPRQAEWLEDLRKEILQFPHGRYDDQVDSIARS